MSETKPMTIEEARTNYAKLKAESDRLWAEKSASEARWASGYYKSETAKAYLDGWENSISQAKEVCHAE